MTRIARIGTQVSAAIAFLIAMFAVVDITLGQLPRRTSENQAAPRLLHNLSRLSVTLWSLHGAASSWIQETVSA